MRRQNIPRLPTMQEGSAINFLCSIKYPTPQPNCEIRKSSIELKFTLISVTICSLIFFICNSSTARFERPCMWFGNACGTLYCTWKKFKVEVSTNRHGQKFTSCCLRPYHDEHTRSRLITEVKHRRARIVLGWGTAWEHLVP